MHSVDFPKRRLSRVSTDGCALGVLMAFYSHHLLTYEMSSEEDKMVAIKSERTLRFAIDHQLNL